MNDLATRYDVGKQLDLDSVDVSITLRPERQRLLVCVDNLLRWIQNVRINQSNSQSINQSINESSSESSINHAIEQSWFVHSGLINAQFGRCDGTKQWQKRTPKCNSARIPGFVPRLWTAFPRGMREAAETASNSVLWSLAEVLGPYNMFQIREIHIILFQHYQRDLQLAQASLNRTVCTLSCTGPNSDSLCGCIPLLQSLRSKVIYSLVSYNFIVQRSCFLYVVFMGILCSRRKRQECGANR